MAVKRSLLFHDGMNDQRERFVIQLMLKSGDGVPGIEDVGDAIVVDVAIRTAQSDAALQLRGIVGRMDADAGTLVHFRQFVGKYIVARFCAERFGAGINALIGARWNAGNVLLVAQVGQLERLAQKKAPVVLLERQGPEGLFPIVGNAGQNHLFHISCIVLVHFFLPPFKRANSSKSSILNKHFPELVNRWTELL